MGRRKPVPKKVKRKQSWKGTPKYQKLKWKRFLISVREMVKQYDKRRK